MRSALEQANYRRLVECPCGLEYTEGGACSHGGAEPYSTRFRNPQGDGVEEGVLGPEGNRIPLSRKVFEADGIQHIWFDREGNAHLGRKEPYPEIA